MVAAVVPILLITTASADEPKAPVVKATAEAKIPTLTYYYFDGWPLCAKISVIVNDLKKTKGKEITFKNVLVGTGKSKEEIKKVMEENSKTWGHVDDEAFDQVDVNDDGKISIDGNFSFKKNLQFLFFHFFLFISEFLKWSLGE